MRAAIVLGELGLFVRARGADHGRADMSEPLASDEPDAARRRVPEHHAILRDRIGLLHEIAHGHALQHHGGRGLVGDVGGQLHQPVGGDQPLLRIAADRAGIGHAVANREVRHALAHGHDLARTFAARRERHRRNRVKPGAVIDVEKVHPRGILLDLRPGRAPARQAGPLPIS